MTKPKSKPKTATHSTVRKANKTASRKRATVAFSKLKSGSDTKHSRIVAMLRAPAGATVARIVSATNWQQHSVRGFLAGVVCKKLGLNLVSELTEKGRVYRIKDGNAVHSAGSRAKQAA